MRYYLVAGERSSDTHASLLMEALKKLDEQALFRGVGGNAMQNAGMELFMSHNAVSFHQTHSLQEQIHSIWELYMKRPLMSTRRRCREDILAYQPHALLLIDFASMNLSLCAFGKRYGIPVFYYISSKIWAFWTGRVHHIGKNVRRIFALMPFEKGFYARYGYGEKVDYIGNPTMGIIKRHQYDKALIEQLQQKEKPLVAVLPGSRRKEILHLLPVLQEVFLRMPHIHFLVACIKEHMDLYKDLENYSHVELHYECSYELVKASRAAIVKSGTGTLETALIGTPQVVCYRTGKWTYRLGKMFIRVGYISLVNLIVEREVVQELIQEHCTAERIIKELKELLEDKIYRMHIEEGYKEVKEALGTETEGALRAAERIIHDLRVHQKQEEA